MRFQLKRVPYTVDDVQVISSQWPTMLLDYVRGNIVYFVDGVRHREDGPAIELANGTKHWYWHGQKLEVSTLKEFQSMIKMRAFW